MMSGSSLPHATPASSLLVLAHNRKAQLIADRGVASTSKPDMNQWSPRHADNRRVAIGVGNALALLSPGDRPSCVQALADHPQTPVGQGLFCMEFVCACNSVGDFVVVVVGLRNRRWEGQRAHGHRAWVIDTCSCTRRLQRVLRHATRHRPTSSG